MYCNSNYLSDPSDINITGSIFADNSPMDIKMLPFSRYLQNQFQLIKMINGLFRCERVVEQWDQFEKEATCLEAWLSTAEVHVKQLNLFSKTQSTDTGHLRQHMKILLVGKYYQYLDYSFVA